MRPLLGYTPLLSPTAGDTVPIHVSTSEPEPVTAELHQLTSWDVGVGMDTRKVACPTLDGIAFPAIDQPMISGSYAAISGPAGSFPSTAAPGFTLAVQAWPTAPRKMEPQEGIQLFFNADSVQVMMAVGSAELVLTESGTAALRIGGAVVVETAAQLLAREWVTIAASFDGDTAIILTAPHVSTQAVHRLGL